MIIIDQVSCFQKNSHHETYRMSNLSLLAVILIRHYYREATLANKSNHPATMFNAEKYDKRDGSNIRDPSPTADLAVLALCRIEAVFGRPDGSARSRTFSISLRSGPGRFRTVTDFFDQLIEKVRNAQARRTCQKWRGPTPSRNSGRVGPARFMQRISGLITPKSTSNTLHFVSVILREFSRCLQQSCAFMTMC